MVPENVAVPFTISGPASPCSAPVSRKQFVAFNWNSDAIPPDTTGPTAPTMIDVGVPASSSGATDVFTFGVLSQSNVTVSFALLFITGTSMNCSPT